MTLHLPVNVQLPAVSTGPFTFAKPDIGKEAAAKRAEKGLPLLDWMQRYRTELKPGIPFDLDSHAYLRAIYEETAQRVVLYKSGQAGISEFLISYALWCCDQRDATTLYVFPTDTHVSDFSAARLGPAIETSDYLAGIVVEGNAAGGKRGADRVTLKRVRDRFLYFRGGQVKPSGQAPQLKSVDADVLILDEVDEIDPRAPAIARKRLGHSSIAEERAASTPTFAGRGIHAEWLESDQREWFVRCWHCGNRQPLTIHDIVTQWDSLDRPVEWHGQREGKAYCACRKCSRAIDRFGKGEWVATNQGAETVGYHVTKLFSPLADIDAIVQSLRSTDETKRRECFNQDLGEPYTPRGGGLSDAVLDECRADYGHAIDPKRPCYMGVDVGSLLHIVVRQAPDKETGQRRQLFAGNVVSFEELQRLWQWHKPVVTVIDALPETRKAREFQADKAPGRVWLAYYAGDSKAEEPAAWNDDKRIVTIDRTRSLDATFARFFDRENTLPANARDIADYYAHLKAPVRVVEKTATGETAQYIESGPDHYAHAENYCAVASLYTGSGAATATTSRVVSRRQIAGMLS